MTETEWKECLPAYAMDKSMIATLASLNAFNHRFKQCMSDEFSERKRCERDAMFQVLIYNRLVSRFTSTKYSENKEKDIDTVRAKDNFLRHVQGTEQ